MQRQLVPYKIGFLLDLHRRGLLDLEPPYQRRAVWSQSFREYFVDTVLLGYPAPPIFLHEVIQEEGTPKFAVIDGKQRLLTVLGFIESEFPVSDRSPLEGLRGRYFEEFDDEDRKTFFSYAFVCEMLESTDAAYLNEIFERYNKNVLRLTRQELRHAKFKGEFADSAEDMARLMVLELPGLPRIASASMRQMKDVELAAVLMLLVEKGPASTTQDEIDQVYAEREDDWPERLTVERRFRDAVDAMRPLAEFDDGVIASTRLRNQGDFYGLFGAVSSLAAQGDLPPARDVVPRLVGFIERVESEEAREGSETADRYFRAARSAANDPSQRRTRVDILRDVIRGEG